MQKYKSNITTTSGAAVRGVPVHVLAEDGSPASIFLDRAGTVQAANPLSTASDGTFYFYAENGRYSLRTTVDGVTITDADVALLWDPAEVLLSGPLAEAVERAEASAAQAEAAVADSGIVDLVASAQNAVVDAQLALADASGLGQAAQEAEDAAASAVLASQVATDAANLAVDAAQDAILASAATIKAYATHAEAAIAAALLPDGADVEVSQDETRAGARTRYKVQGGALVFVINLDQLRLDLAKTGGAGMIGFMAPGGAGPYTVQDIASPGGAALVGFKQAGSGSSSATAQDKLRERVSAADKGAAGDGATNDTSKFAVIEAEFKGREVDLLGKTYRVDRTPSACEYKNGFFKLASGAVFPAYRDLSQASRGAETTLKSQSSDPRYAVPPGLAGAIVVLGDSISHGAFVGNSYQNGWVNILKRMMNAETGGRGYGFTPLVTMGSGPTLTQEVHDVAISGAWAALESSTGGGDVLQGLSYTSSTPGNTITITCPTFQTSVRIWYIEDVGAGTFSYALNGGAPVNVATAAGARNTVKSKLIPVNDNGAGAFTLVLTVVSGAVTLTGIGYETSPNVGAEIAGNVVQNFSSSGRRLRYATEDMIDLACRGSTLILALGYNDSSDVETDPAYNAAYQQVIDWVIKYCLKYNTTLVVTDFCWWSAPSNKARMGLKRAAFETRGIYVPLPDYLTRDQLVKNEFSESYYMVDALQKWVDAAHPNKHGAKWIAETVAKAMGLSCTSKRQALMHHDFPWPLQFAASSPFKNSSLQMPYLSYVKRVGDSFVYSIRAVTKSANSIPVGADYLLNKPNDTANSRQLQTLCTTNFSLPLPLQMHPGTGAVSTAITTGFFGDIKVSSFAPYLNAIDCTLTLPVDTTVDAQ